jgi:hypothetical protein
MIRDLANNVSAAYTLTPATRNSDATGTSVDLQGFRSAAIFLQVGVGGITFDGTNRLDMVMEHSDDGTTWAPVVQADLNVLQTSGVAGTVTGSGIVRVFNAAHAAASFTEIGYIGGRRFVRVTSDFSGTHATGTPIAVLVVRGEPINTPVA